MLTYAHGRPSHPPAAEDGRSVMAVVWNDAEIDGRR
ncbi:hypothetical protein SAMN05444170_5789 [Bradyrhizobium erythrophlei]|jgi:hypothetical protein|uniref:Uncharacterized protein n=1 Tax=Bradyrhizobium erythrophlei TaxID=1437360 RepID=A0A1M7UMD4_9BRAD|nr:hypothetical protein SAMN05444170_5789 [Bradyrhizobium erythrophlei]